MKNTILPFNIPYCSESKKIIKAEYSAIFIYINFVVAILLFYMLLPLLFCFYFQYFIFMLCCLTKLHTMCYTIFFPNSPAIFIIRQFSRFGPNKIENNLYQQHCVVQTNSLSTYFVYLRILKKTIFLEAVKTKFLQLSLQGGKPMLNSSEAVYVK